MLGICIPDNKFSGYLDLYFRKPVVLLPGEALKTYQQGDKTMYLIKSNTGLRKIPEPVYQVGETYYLKETWCTNTDKSMIFYKSDFENKICILKYWKNKAQMPQAAARTFIKIISCEFVYVPDEAVGYRYEYEIVPGLNGLND